MLSMFTDEKKTLVVYLSGSIKKTTSKADNQYWGETEKQDLQTGAENTRVVFLDPNERTDDLSDTVSLLGRDLLQVVISDAVLVDGRDKRGIGIGAEIDRAETQHIPIVAIVPERTVYHNVNINVLDQHIPEWKHPFIFGYTDHIAQDFVAAGRILSIDIQPRKENTLAAPVSNRILSAMQHYIGTQLERDRPMYELYQTNAQVKSRIDAIREMSLAPEVSAATSSVPPVNFRASGF